VNFFDADRLAGKDRAEVNLLCSKQMRPHLVTTMTLSMDTPSQSRDLKFNQPAITIDPEARSQIVTKKGR
jgi:hypothetical protein